MKKLNHKKVDLLFGKLDTTNLEYIFNKVVKHIETNSRTIFGNYLASDYGNVWGEGHDPKEFVLSSTIYESRFGKPKFHYYTYQNKDSKRIPIPLDFIKIIERNLNMDMSWVDSIYVNIYKEGNGAFPHIDHTEIDPSYPIVSLTLGHASTFTLSTEYNFLDQEEFNTEFWEKSNKLEFMLGHGDIIVFGGKYRLSAHKTGDKLYPSPVDKLPTIKVGSGEKTLCYLEKYRINLTFRKSV